MESKSSDESELTEYLQKVSAIPELTPEEEKQLAYRVEEGDVEARDRLVRANLRLVVAVARRHADGNRSLQSLLQEGNLGLLRAVDAYNPANDKNFAEIANYWIEYAIQHTLSSGNQG